MFHQSEPTLEHFLTTLALERFLRSLIGELRHCHNNCFRLLRYHRVTVVAVQSIFFDVPKTTQTLGALVGELAVGRDVLCELAFVADAYIAFGTCKCGVDAVMFTK